MAWDFQPSLDFGSIYSLAGNFIGVANLKMDCGCIADDK